MATRKAARPDSVFISPYLYSVVYTEKVNRPAETELLDGLHDTDKLTIYIDSTIAHDRTCAILVHENLHGLFHAAQTGLDSEKEEAICSSLQSPMLAWLRDNKDGLIKFLTA